MRFDALRKIYVIFFAFATLASLDVLAKTPSKAQKQAPAAPAPDPIASASAEQLIKNFMFVGDFEEKDPTRTNSHEVFWRYPVSLPKISFDFQGLPPFRDPSLGEDFPKTEGQGRAVQHLNRGRQLFLAGELEEARKTWLGGRARYGKDYPQHRRADYFIAFSFLYTGIELLEKTQQDYLTHDVRQSFVNAATFMSWAFDRKKDLPDPLLERIAPKAYYNQAVIYYLYERWAGVVGAATLGLDFLRKTGRSDYRSELRRMLAETHIQNHDYLEAVRELDLALRQDQKLETAAAIFARIADIYFDLNNFELAEEVYAVASRIDKELHSVRPSQYVLRGESLFWMGRFKEAIKALQYAQHAAAMPSSRDEHGSALLPLARDELDLDMQALISMRIADSWLALGDYERAKLAYFQHANEFRQHLTAAFAKIRLACLELPHYDGNNINHARSLLAELKDQADLIPAPAQELAWTCEIGSYAQHERTPEMVDRVRSFVARYPQSAFLKELSQPVREVQARHIDGYFKAGDAYGAVDFFEKTRKALFPQVSDQLGAQLFAAYVDINQADKAAPFLSAYTKLNLDDFAWLRLATALVEIAAKAPPSERPLWEKRNRALADKLESLKIQLDPEVKSRLALNRILAQPLSSLHLGWILKLAESWAERDISLGCDLVYPLLDRMQKMEEKNLPKGFQQSAMNFIDENLRDLLRFETNCAYSMMEFEIGLYRGKMSILADKYAARDYLSLNPTTAAIVWNVAEQSFESGSIEGAESLWKLLVAKGGATLPEVRYAQARLDKSRSELEDLWQR